MFRKNAFTTKEVTQILGIHAQTFEGWLRKAILRPRIYAPSGKGTTRLFDLQNLFEGSLVKRLARDQYPLEFIRAVLGHIEERQLIQTFLDRVSKGEKTESRYYLLWVGDYAEDYNGRPSFMDLVEVRKPETELRFDFDVFERVLVLNLSRLFNRIYIELEEFGVNL